MDETVKRRNLNKFYNFSFESNTFLNTPKRGEFRLNVRGGVLHPLSRGPWNAPFVRPSNCATMKLCGVHGEVDKRDKCREEGEVIYTVRRPIASKGMVQLAPNTYGPPFVLRAFLSAPCQPINASFPVYGAFWRVYAVNVDPGVYLSSASRSALSGGGKYFEKDSSTISCSFIRRSM